MDSGLPDQPVERRPSRVEEKGPVGTLARQRPVEADEKPRVREVGKGRSAGDRAGIGSVPRPGLRRQGRRGQDQRD